MLWIALLCFAACNNKTSSEIEENSNVYKWQITNEASLSLSAKEANRMLQSLYEDREIDTTYFAIINIDSLCDAKDIQVQLPEKLIIARFLRKEFRSTLETDTANSKNYVIYWIDGDYEIRIERYDNILQGSIISDNYKIIIESLSDTEFALLKVNLQYSPIEYKPDTIIANNDLFGLWKHFYIYDGKFKCTLLDDEWQLILSTDSTFEYYKNKELLDNGSWAVGHTDYFVNKYENMTQWQDSIVFKGKDTTIIRFFIYPDSSDYYRLKIIPFYPPLDWQDYSGSLEYWDRYSL